MCSVSENETLTGHYRRVTLFWLRHGLIHLSLPVLSLMIGTSGTMVISSSWNSSLPLCQGQLQRFTAANQQNTAACIKYKQAEHGEAAKPLKMSVLRHKTCCWLVSKWLFSVCMQWREGVDVGKLFGSFVVRAANWEMSLFKLSVDSHFWIISIHLESYWSELSKSIHWCSLGSSFHVWFHSLQCNF